MECDPVDKLDVVSVAVPWLTVAVPSKAAPSKNCITPVAFAGITEAVKVTERPGLDGLRLDATVVVVFALFTVCETGPDKLPL